MSHHGLPKPYRAWVVGGTGATGKELLQLLLNDPDCHQVESWVRKHSGTQHPKLLEREVNFSDRGLFDPMKADVFFCCLGSTQKQAGSKQAFQAIDLDLVVQLARHGERSAVKRMVVISAMGARSGSKVFYNHVKGEMEWQIEKLNFDHTVVVRPSLLEAKRTEFRFGETMGLWAMKGFNPLIPKKYRRIRTDVLARAMLRLAKSAQARFSIVESDALSALGTTDASGHPGK